MYKEQCEEYAYWCWGVKGYLKIFVLSYKFIGFHTRSSRKKINWKDHKQNQAQDIDHNVIEIIIG